MELFHSARVVATSAYTLKTLAVRADVFLAICHGSKQLHMPGNTLHAGTRQGVALARGTQWDVTNDPQGAREYQAIALAFPDDLLAELNALDGCMSIPVMHSAHVLDVDEELDRLDSHVKEIRRVLKQSEPVGRRLDFLLQEFNREANTLGSKSVDVRTTNLVVELKVLIDQIREQVQNIE